MSDTQDEVDVKPIIININELPMEDEVKEQEGISKVKYVTTTDSNDEVTTIEDISNNRYVSCTITN